MKTQVLSLNGSKSEELELPPVFSTPLRTDLLHKAYVNLESHKFQKQGRYRNAGMDVVAE